MATPDTLKSLYLELEAAHAAMFEHAEKGDWDNVTQCAQQGNEVLQRLIELQQSTESDVKIDPSLQPVIEHILELTEKLKAIAGPLRDDLSSDIAANVQRTRINSHYGV